MTGIVPCCISKLFQPFKYVLSPKQILHNIAITTQNEYTDEYFAY